MTDLWRQIQQTLRDRGYGLGSAGPNADGVDGTPGELTAAAVFAELLKIGPAAPREVERHGVGDTGAFFASLRASALFVGGLDQGQVDGINGLTLAMAGAAWPIAWAAYGLATAYHETAHTLQPIHEHGGDGYFRQMYDIAGDRPDRAKLLGNTAPGDGALYHGRGFVQLTGRTNYRKAGAALGLPLESSPDLALHQDIASKVLVHGMEEGWFSGRKLADMLPSSHPATFADFKAARPIINGHDRDSDIGNYALRFQAALGAGRWG